MTTGVGGHRAAITVSHIEFDPPRPLTDYVVDGEIVDGCEPNGKALSWDAIETMNAALRDRTPCQYLVIGEDRYSDGRSYLDVGINPDWMRSNTDYQRPVGEKLWVWVCPDCGAKGGSHEKVTITGRTGSLVTVSCPRAPAKRSFGR